MVAGRICGVDRDFVGTRLNLVLVIRRNMCQLTSHLVQGNRQGLCPLAEVQSTLIQNPYTFRLSQMAFVIC